MNTYNSLINNLEELELNRFRENIDTYLDMIASGEKTALDAIYELTRSELDFRKQQESGKEYYISYPHLHLEFVDILLQNLLLF